MIFKDNEYKKKYDCVMDELYKKYNDEYLCWKESNEEDILRWSNECRACYLGVCENEYCGK